MRCLITQSLVLVIAALCLTGSVVQSAYAAQLRVATFRSDITPPLGHLLCRKPLATVEHPLTAKGIVLEDDDKRYVLCALDWCTLGTSTYSMFRSKVAAAVGTDVSRVAVQCVHQHTAISVDGDAQKLLDREENPPQYLDLKFLDDVSDRLAEAVKESLRGLQPFNQIGTGQAKVDRVASIRRVLTEDGKALTRWSSCDDPELRAMPEGPIDPILKTITLARDNRPLVRLHYYATHPQSFYGDGRASIDVPGIARERIENEEQVFQIYFTGCSGDVTMGKYNDGSRSARDELTERLYAGMKASIASTQIIPVSVLEWRTVPLLLTPRTDGDYDDAENCAKLKDPKLDDTQRIWAASRIACSERLKRPIELSSLRFGSIHILHLPGEPMVEFQFFAQKVKPDEFVVVAGYSDGSPGYICTEQAFKEGGYEPSASQVIPQSETVLKKSIGELLK
ncbi:MAG: hypothetical protein ABIH23_13870 [bacterium]